MSQPPHLRHLAIVRDTAIRKTTFYYVHYSVTNFAKLVESGASSWEAVEFPPQKAKAAKCDIPAVDAVAHRDKYGFHDSNAVEKLLKNGNASLFEALAICKPPTYLLSSSDPMPVKLPDGHFSTCWNPGQTLIYLLMNRSDGYGQTSRCWKSHTVAD